MSDDKYEGTDFPIGTPKQPVNNYVDAVAIVSLTATEIIARQEEKREKFSELWNSLSTEEKVYFYFYIMEQTRGLRGEK